MRYGVWRPGTPNYYAGRVGERLRAVVIHRMVGYLYGTDSWFKNRDSGASTHFGIGWASLADETADKVSVYQWVDTVDTAWGWAARPTDTVERGAAAILNLASADLNRQVIHIELGQFHAPNVNLETQPFRPSIYRALNGLLGAIDRAHPGLVLLEHNDVSTKPCPGPIDWSQIGGGYGGPLVKAATPQETDMILLPSEVFPIGTKAIFAAGTTYDLYAVVNGVIQRKQLVTLPDRGTWAHANARLVLNGDAAHAGVLLADGSYEGWVVSGWGPQPTIELPAPVTSGVPVEEVHQALINMRGRTIAAYSAGGTERALAVQP